MFYLQGDKIISATLSSSVPLFLQVNYLQITTKFTKNILFYLFQSNMQAHKTLLLILYPSTNTQYTSSENINISTESNTITS